MNKHKNRYPRRQKSYWKVGNPFVQVLELIYVPYTRKSRAGIEYTYHKREFRLK